MSPTKKPILPLIVLGVCLIAFLASFVFLFNDRARNQLRTLFASSDRQILSVATADLTGKGSLYRVLKVMTNEGLFVEVYQTNDKSERSLVDRYQLPDRRDGYFHINGQATNLALKDLDADGIPEIVAPTYDRDLNPHLNALKVDPQTRKIELFTGDNP